MKKGIKITLWVVGLIAFSILALAGYAQLSYSSYLKSGEKLVENAIKNNIPVEEAKPVLSNDARKIAAGVISDKVDTVFLGYYLGMSKSEVDTQTRRNVAERKLKRSSDSYTYNLLVFDGDEEAKVPFEVFFNYYEDKLYRVALGYANFVGGFSIFDSTVLPYDKALEIIDGTLKDKFISDGRVRYDVLDDYVYYYKGNTEIALKREKQSNEIGDTIVKYTIEFIDCHLSDLAKAAKKELNKQLASEKEERDNQSNENTKKKAASDF